MRSILIASGYSGTPPNWSANFTPLRSTSIPGTAFLGSVNLPARTMAQPILSVDEKSGYETWQNTITQFIAMRQLDKKLHTGLVDWEITNLD